MVATAGDGRRFGRYEVIERIGSGGMGVVLAAHDPELDRRVAIKILRSEPTVDADKPAEYTVRLDRAGNQRNLRRERLLAEGRAMARLSHPNLVAVFEVGEVNGQVFLVMEHVEGTTLAAWCRDVQRSWRELVRAFVQAGRGLAAAHAAGLVHGDFKPTNALVDRTNRVRIIDFGVAHATGAHPAGSRAAGTPSYAAPEVLRGCPADPRADQFSFALSLYRELFAAWPFPEPGDDGDPLARFEDGPRPAPRGRVPRRIARAVRRGLCPDPGGRHASMEDLLVALDPDRGRRHRLAAAAMAVAVALAWSAPLLSRSAEPTDPTCARAADRLANVWSPDRQQALGAALAATGRPHAAQTTALVAARLDQYGAAWLREYREACDATFARGDASRQRFAERAACLDRRLDQMRVATGTLVVRPDANVADNAVAIATSLEPAASCAEEGTRGRDSPLPSDPGVRAMVARLTAEVDRAEAELQAGRHSQAIAASSVVTAQTPLLDDPRLFARAWWIIGRGLVQVGAPEQANQAFVAALALAERGRDGSRATHVLLDMAHLVAWKLKRPAEAQRLLAVAAAGLEGIAGPGRDIMRVRLLLVEGDLASIEGRVVDEERVRRQALELGRSIYPAEHPRIADAELRLAATLTSLGRTAEAREHHLHALSIHEKNFGPMHPVIAITLNGLGETYRMEGRLDEARVHYQKSLAILQRSPNPQDHACVLTNLGIVESMAGNLGEARRLLDAALAEREEMLGADHVDVANSLFNLAVLLDAGGEYRRALELFQRSLAIHSGRFGPGHHLVGVDLGAIASVLCGLRRWRDALDHAGRAERILRERVGPDSPLLSEPLLYGGIARTALGRPGEAIADLERARALRPEGAAPRAEAALALARALWDSRADRGRALLLARDARAVLAAGGPRWARVRREADRWLERRAALDRATTRR